MISTLQYFYLNLFISNHTTMSTLWYFINTFIYNQLKPQQALNILVKEERCWALFYKSMYTLHTICWMYKYRLQIKLDLKKNYNHITMSTLRYFDLNTFIYDHITASTKRYFDLNLLVYGHAIESNLRYSDMNLSMYDSVITSTLRYLDLKLVIYCYAMISRFITPNYCFTTGPIRSSDVIRMEK
jgi:hypothetical protein